MLMSSTGNISALLALCVGNSPVTGEFPAQRPVTRSSDVFLDLHLNERLSKQPWGWWMETPSWSLWRPCNVNIKNDAILVVRQAVIQTQTQIIFMSENFCILIKISLKFIPKGPINNNPALVQIMAWHRIGDKPLTEPMLTWPPWNC